MSVAIEASDEVDADGVGAGSLAFPAMALAGSDRSLYVAIGGRFGLASTNVSAISRGADTYAEQAESDLGSSTAFVWCSTNQPQTTSAVLTVTSPPAGGTWGAQYISVTGANQTTRIENLTLNSDQLCTGGMTAQAIASATGDLVMDMVTGINGLTIGAASETSQTEREASTFAPPSTSWAMKTSTKPGETSATMGWAITGSTDEANHYAWNIPSSSTPPVNTVPVSGVATTSLEARAIGSPSVVDSVGPVSIAFTNTGAGLMTFTLAGPVTIKAGTTNGTNVVTLENGTTDAEYNTVLLTMTYQGAAGFHGKDTITMLTTGGTGGVLTDNTPTWYVLNDPYSVTLTSTEAADADQETDIIATLATVTLKLNSNETNDTVNMTSTDNTGTPLVDSTSFVVGIASYFATFSPEGFIRVRRRGSET